MNIKILELIDKSIESRKKYFNELKDGLFSKKQKKSLYKLQIQLQLLRRLKRKIIRINRRDIVDVEKKG